MNASKVKELPRLDRRLRTEIPVLTDRDINACVRDVVKKNRTGTSVRMDTSNPPR
jgi:hypothetical protein